MQVSPIKMHAGPFIAIAKKSDVYPMLQYKIRVGTGVPAVHSIDIVDHIDDVPARRHGTHQYSQFSI
jgi:hypothetical protein